MHIAPKVKKSICFLKLSLLSKKASKNKKRAVVKPRNPEEKMKLEDRLGQTFLAYTLFHCLLQMKSEKPISHNKFCPPAASVKRMHKHPTFSAQKMLRA
jgi:hypothetical protein